MQSNVLAEIKRLTEQMTRPRNVLLVEDDDALRWSVADLLKQYDCSVDETGNGIDGNSLAGAKEYDFAIIDINLPGISGIEICKTIKNKSSKTDIIIMTGENHLQLDGYVVVFPKPFDFELLERQIAGMTGKPYA